MAATLDGPLFTGPFADVVALLEKWGTRATTRREDHPVDAVADTYDRAAGELQLALAAAQARTRRLTPAEYAALPHVDVTPQTVRNWCRDGELPDARLTPHGWEIPAEAARVPKAATRRTAA